VAVSTAIRRELTDQGVDPGAIESIPNGVDTDRFAPAGTAEKAEMRRALQIEPGALVAAFTGRLVSYKGLPLLLRVWDDLCREHPDALLLLVGEGGLDMHACEDELRRCVEERGVGARVRFTGAVTNVESHLKAADLFVFPTENEAFGLALVEAMACGLPSVSTKVGGLVDIVEPDVDGLAIDAGDASQLGRALDRLLRDAVLRERLGRAAAAKARAQFGADVVTARYAELFETLVAGR
jgi:glycosyltransferase involved in cell wall biosynthesis